MRSEVDIDDEVLKHFQHQDMCKFPMHKAYVENGIPLPALPYRFVMEKAAKLTHHVDITFTGDYGPQKSSTVQERCGWSTARNDYYRTIEWFNEKRHLCDDEVVNLILSKTKEQSISIGMMFAERKETALTVINAVERMFKAVKLIRHPKQMFRAIWGRKPSRAEMRKLKRTAAYVTRKAGTVGDAWLEYRYVWTPLVLDVRDSMQALAKQKEKMYRYSQSASKFFEEEKYFDKVCIHQAPYDSDATVHGYYGTHIKYYYDVTNPLATAWSSLADPVQLLWDLVPWSFVVDWFADLSTYLDLRSATWGLTFTDGYVSQLRVIKTTFGPVTYTVSASPWYGWTNTYECYPALPDHLYILNDRIVLSDFPQARLVFPLEEGLNLKRITDLIALINGLLERRFNRSLPHNEAYKHAS